MPTMHWRGVFFLLAVGPVLFAGEEAAPPSLRPAPVNGMRAAVQQAVWDRDIPGALWWLEHQGVTVEGGLGFRARVPVPERMTQDAIFDMASLTKVMATAPSVLLLVEQGRLGLEDRVCTRLPEFTGEGREFITIRQLLTHTSGLKPSIPANPPWAGYETGIRLACGSVPFHLPDAAFRYSDINFILLGEIVRRVSGLPLDRFAAQNFYIPLKMAETGFLPAAAEWARIVPTEKDEAGTMLRGVVHDPSARRMGGVAGHAGLFSTLRDTARYARMILQGGELDGVRVLKGETVRLMTAVHTPPAMTDQRALGWDVATRYSRPRGALFPVGSFGHTGFTGTCLWLDPASGTFFVFLSSRLHATRRGADVRPLYEKIGTLAAQAAGYGGPAPPK